MDIDFIGREREIESLTKCMESNQAQLVVVYGRRRVGKTFLIESFFEDNFAFTYTGAYNQPKSVQLMNFSDEIRFQTGVDIDIPQTWREAFAELRTYLSGLDKDKKQVVFFDEMPWMDTHKSDFLPTFEWFWNSWGSKQKNLVFVICGSATSWMMENISDNKGGLFNRQTCRIYLEHFNLSETEKFLKTKNINWSRMDIAECYMIMGGMPYYLNLLNSSMDFRQNIDELFFRKKGQLWDEFTHLYHTLFNNGDVYMDLVELLSKKKSGMTRAEITEANIISSSNTINKILGNLVSSGFVRVYSYYGHKKKEEVYQLCDYYSLFYFKFIKDNYGKDEHFWSKSYENAKINNWRGNSFELLCKDHIRQIKRAMGIEGVVSEEYDWFTRKKDNKKDERGAQIDLLIDRRDMTVNICEMKFLRNEFSIDINYEEELRNKIEAFRREAEPKKTILLTMVTTWGVKKNKYSGIVTNQVVLDDLFE